MHFKRKRVFVIYSLQEHLIIIAISFCNLEGTALIKIRILRATTFINYPSTGHKTTLTNIRPVMDFTGKYSKSPFKYHFMTGDIKQTLNRRPHRK